MLLSKKVLATATGMLVALSVAAIAQQPTGGGRSARQASPGDSLLITGTIDWIETSQVSALREGVIKQLEYRVGDRVEKDKPIGFLHKKAAELAEAKAKIAAEQEGPVKSAKAKSQLATSELARLRRLEKMGPFTSISEVEKAEAELQVAEAQITEATENKKVAGAEYEIAKQIVAEHTIIAPFTGIVIERIKNPGEAVRANEAVVQLGRSDQLRFMGYLPLESSARVQVGDIVEVRATVDNANLPLEQKTFPGKIISISREIGSVRKTDIQVIAEVNDVEDLQHPELTLRPGLKAEMRILVRTPQSGATVGLKTSR
jgi:multidrug resistance efflux pump